MNDVFHYDEVSSKLKTQFVHIIKDVFGSTVARYGVMSTACRTASEITEVLCREYGVFRLNPPTGRADIDLYNWFLEIADINECLDFIDFTLNYFVENGSRGMVPATEAVAEFNQRALEDGFGYQFENNQLIRVDSN